MAATYLLIVAGSLGGGAPVSPALVCKVRHDTVSGPVSYPTGGFVVDWSADFKTFYVVTMTLQAQGALPISQLVVKQDVPSPGKFTTQVNVLGVGVGTTVELAAGTNLSTTQWRVRAEGTYL